VGALNGITDNGIKEREIERKKKREREISTIL
jgi:hypothetical protein